MLVMECIGILILMSGPINGMLIVPMVRVPGQAWWLHAAQKMERTLASLSTHLLFNVYCLVLIACRYVAPCEGILDDGYAINPCKVAVKFME